GCRGLWDLVPSSWGGPGNLPASYLAPTAPAGSDWHPFASAANAAASTLHSSHAHSHRSDRPPWWRPDCAAEPGPSLPVRRPSPPQSPPPGACEPHVPIERLHRSAPPTLGHRPHPSLPSFLALLCFSSAFF